jgi:Uma2 family endonuclease
LAEPAAPLRMTVDEFLRWDGGDDTRYELIHGHVTAMAPAADRHGSIAGNAHVEIDRALEARAPCRSVLEGGVWIDDDNYYVADVVATCAPPSDSIAVRDPMLIVEVISPSNEKDELATKVQAYIKLASVQEIWLLDSRKRWFQQWRRAGAEQWIVTLPLAGDARFESPTLAATVALDRLYRNTGLAPTVAGA